jgi:carbon monoxide dehydrogenase subunit G
MGIVESTVVVARPVEDVFQFFLDFDRSAAGLGIESATREPKGPTEVGTTFRLRDKAGSKTRESTTRITSIEPNRKIGFDGTVGPLRPRGAYIFEPTEHGTRLTVRIDPNPIGPLKLASPLVTRMGRRIWDKRLERIKALLEAPEA